MTREMRKDRETMATTIPQADVATTTNRTLNTMDELAYKELETENKNLKNSLGEGADKITVLQLRCDNYETMRLKALKLLQEMRDIIDKKEKK